MTATTRRVAGWYHDDADAAVLRYWDGTSWTPHTAGRRAVDPPSAGTTAPLPGRSGDDTATARLPLDHATVRIEPREQTTVPAAPAAPAPADVVPRAFAGASAGPAARLTVLGAALAATSLVVACAALAISLAR